jgi:hypothetical protein
MHESRSNRSSPSERRPIDGRATKQRQHSYSSRLLWGEEIRCFCDLPATCITAPTLGNIYECHYARKRRNELDKRTAEEMVMDDLNAMRHAQQEQLKFQVRYGGQLSLNEEGQHGRLLD